MASPKVGDRIIFKRDDGQYDVSEITGARQVIRGGIASLDEARRTARADLIEGGQLWYHHHEDAPNHLEPL